jgi:hypothetical protein
VWSLIEGAPLSVNRGDEPPEIPDSAIAGIRETMDRMVGSYLQRRGKKRYCDKSLGTAHFADLLLRVYPEAKFVCLYRHPMDVIASGLEACPFGLNGYGFDPYIASTPGNMVIALARFWADNTATILAVEERFPTRCIRVRYEDLVTDPEGSADEIFRFLDCAPAPGISTACFSAEREQFGPGDHKIWYTSEISPESVGRGWLIPAALIGPQVLDTINELTGKLGYLPVDGNWGTTAPPADMRLPAASTDCPADVSQRPAEMRATEDRGPQHSQMLGSRLQASLARAGQRTTSHWEPCTSETMVVVSVPDDPREPAEHWLVDLGAKTVTFTSSAAQENSDWDVIGLANVWEKVIAGKLNLSAALRSYQLRYCDSDESQEPVAAATRIGILADLLALADWRTEGR